MDDLIDEMLAEYGPRYILDVPISEDEERRLPWPLRLQWPFTNLDDRVPNPVRLPSDEWVEVLTDAKDECEDPLDISDIEITDGMHARAGRLALNARMKDKRAARLLASLPEGEFILKLKFLREHPEMIGFLKTFDPVRVERKKGRLSLRSPGTPDLEY